MYDKDVVELALEALSLGFTQREAAELCGASRTAVASWALGRLPHPRADRSHPPAKMVPPEQPASEGARMKHEEPLPRPSESERRLYEPPATGPLAGLEPSQIENLLLRAVLDDLKAGGWDPASISNRSKCELGERLRLATGLPLRSITAFLRISKSSYEYHRARLGADKYAALRAEVRAVFEEGGSRWGYRTIWARLRRSGTVVSEKVVRRIMREEGLQVVYDRRRRRWSSYGGEASPAPPNLVARRFSAPAPDMLWLTDITEFRLPAGKVYLSPVIDCFDGMPVAWSAGTRPTAELADASLRAAVERMGPGAHPVVHSDRGFHYRLPGWTAICAEHGLVRSMSAKGCTPDNAAMEGFFGRLKNEFFYYRDWEGVGTGEFIEMLDDYMRYYRDGRIKRSLGWLSPAEHRRKLGYAV